MSDSLACDRCGKIGYRKLSRISPEGWYYAEFKDESTGEIYYLYACSLVCMQVEWKPGPGSMRG